MCVCLYTYMYKIITSFKDKYDCMKKKRRDNIVLKALIIYYYEHLCSLLQEMLTKSNYVYKIFVKVLTKGRFREDGLSIF